MDPDELARLIALGRTVVAGSAALIAGLKHHLDQARGEAAAAREACLRWCPPALVQQQPLTSEEQTVMRRVEQGDVEGLRLHPTRGFRQALT